MPFANPRIVFGRNNAGIALYTIPFLLCSASIGQHIDKSPAWGAHEAGALVEKENLASVRLLEYLGFTYERDVTERGREYQLLEKKL